jgi:NO-binding membrane sensor protein with MHYT domain
VSALSPIVWELGLVVVSLVVFVVWQTVTLRRDMRITQEAKRAREAAERNVATGGDPPA